MSRTVVSLFSGLGGLDLGFERAGFRIIWANDCNKDAVSSYQKNFDVQPVHGSISDIDLRTIPESDVIIGGPPCQSFSLVGRRQPDDSRGQLVFRFVDVVANKRPQAFVMENVAGIAASKINGVRLTDILLEKFENLGYRTTLNRLVATDFGVPQLRRRMLIIGALGFHPPTPHGANFLKDAYGVSYLGRTASDALGDLGDCVSKGQFARYRKAYEPSKYARLMRVSGQPAVSLHECPRMSATDTSLVRCIPPGGNYMDVPDHLATPRIMRFKETGGRTTTYGRLHPDRPSHTINTYFRRPNVGMNFHYSEPRLITPREAMRLQSFPDDIELEYTSQDGRNALIGNAVPPLMAQGVAWSLNQSWPA